MKTINVTLVSHYNKVTKVVKLTEEKVTTLKRMVNDQECPLGQVIGDDEDRVIDGYPTKVFSPYQLKAIKNALCGTDYFDKVEF